MKNPFKCIPPFGSISALLTVGLLFLAVPGVYAQGDEDSAKLPASMSLSYKISDGIKSIKVEVSTKVDEKSVPVENIIVNLYATEVKKYDPETAEGWLGNLVTNEDGIGRFIFQDQFYKLTAGKHSMTFIVTSNSDLRFEDMEEEITMNDALIELTFNEDSITSVVARLTKFEEAEEIPAPETAMTLLIKRSLGMLPFGEEGLTTDEDGEVTADLPADIPGNANGTITVVARYEDEDNNGVIEVSKSIPWKILPKPNKLMGRTLYSAGNNAPIPLVIASVTIICLIWGIIIYLIYLLLQIRKLGKNSK